MPSTLGVVGEVLLALSSPVREREDPDRGALRSPRPARRTSRRPRRAPARSGDAARSPWSCRPRPSPATMRYFAGRCRRRGAHEVGLAGPCRAGGAAAADVDPAVAVDEVVPSMWGIAMSLAAVEVRRRLDRRRPRRASAASTGAAATASGGGGQRRHGLATGVVHVHCLRHPRIAALCRCASNLVRAAPAPHASLRPMILRMSSLFLRTLREDPADAEVPSHRLLVRAGYIRRAAPGIYTWLPLGLRVLRKVEQIVREEMDAIGAQELLSPRCCRASPTRRAAAGPSTATASSGSRTARAPTTCSGRRTRRCSPSSVKDLYSSYKDLPLSLYQIQTKYRDEARPRAGVLRGREFVMKDSYSFDVDDAGLDASLPAHREAYIRIFDRLGFDYVIVKAMSGAMGGSKSEEFLAEAEVGEDTYVRCTNCDYAANVEAVARPAARARAVRRRARRARRGHARTPRPSTRWSPTSTRSSPRDDRPWAAGGHAEERAGRAQAPRRHPRAAGHRRARRPRGRPEAARGRSSSRPRSRPSTRRTSQATPRWPRATSAPACWARRTRPASATCSTPGSSTGTRWVTGADVTGSHVLDLVAGRDFTADGTIEAAEVRDGDACPNCDGGTLESRARHRDGPHLPARPQVRRGARPQGARRERQARHRHHGLLRHRRLAGRRGDRRGQPRRARPGLAARVAPADVHIVATGKDDGDLRGRRARWPPSWRRQGIDGALRRPPARSAPA